MVHMKAGNRTKTCQVQKMKDTENWAQNNKVRNKNMKMYNGNRRSNISVMHWNLGPRNWNNKREDIQLLVDQQKPDFLYVSEANLYNHIPEHERDIEGYSLICAKTTSRLGYSRIVLLCKDGIQYKVQNDLMQDDISSIWVHVGGRGRNGLHIGGAYREHTLPAQPEPNISNDILQQELRWYKFINQWISASNRGPCLIIGDLNLDILTWNDPEQAHINMVEKTKDEISTRNFIQVVKGATRFCRDTRPSLLDHIWVNTPGKVSGIKNNTRGTADHNNIAANYRLNGTITSNIVRKGRDRRNYNEEELKRRTNLTSWNSVFDSNNVDTACFEFESKFVDILDDLAPIKTVQTRNRRCDWISPTTKQLMKDRDHTRDKAVASNQLEDWTQYRKLKNKCTTKYKTG